MSTEERKPVIGITMGDFNGIGPEVVMKALAQNKFSKYCTIVYYSSTKVISKYKQLLELNDWQYLSIPRVDQANPKQINVINCVPEAHEVEVGTPTDISGKAAVLSLQRAVKDLKEGRIDAVVTAPIDKANVQSDIFKYPGHTEFFAHEFEAKNSLMFMVSDTLKVGLVTGHYPIEKVKTKITKEKIISQALAMIESLKIDYGITKPKLAVLGLNPHAGDGGLLGKEENDIILPAIQELKNNGHLVFGPFPSDGFFANAAYSKFDATLAMYHDQGLIPFKMLAFEDGVNFTAGLSIIRTSPDHGTAFDIAGKNIANESSMINAIFTAIKLFNTRTENLELKKNALAKKVVLEREKI